jgi:hypothetical protein
MGRDGTRLQPEPKETHQQNKRDFTVVQVHVSCSHKTNLARFRFCCPIASESSVAGGNMPFWDHKPCAGISRIRGGKTAEKRVELTSKVKTEPRSEKTSRLLFFSKCPSFDYQAQQQGHHVSDLGAIWCPLQGIFLQRGIQRLSMTTRMEQECPSTILCRILPLHAEIETGAYGPCGTA